MRLGVSLSPGILIPGRAGETEKQVLRIFGGASALLRFLRDLGAGSVELRTVAPEDDGGEILAAAEAIWAEGMSVTVHGALPKRETPFGTAYPSMLPLLRQARERQPGPLVFTVHACSAETGDRAAYARLTREILARWCRGAALPGLRFALEENREKGKCDPGDSPEGVVSILEGLPEDLCGACFDFGHHCHNMQKAGLPAGTPPPETFLRRTVHTHIHALGVNGTHMPFSPETRLPLEAYLTALAGAGYGGILNLELSFERFGRIPLREGLRDSLACLAGAARRLSER